MQKSYQVVTCDPSIFRAYDIRGIVDSQLNDNVYFTIGCAIAKMMMNMGKHKILLARDGRLTSLSYSQALASGLQYFGIEVITIGLVPTALMYYGCISTDIDCGLMVTGSHNPKNYNGLKIVLAGKTLVQEDILNILDQVQQIDSGIQGHPNMSDSVDLDVVSPYLDYIFKDIQLKKPLKVVIDYGHGAGAVLGHKLFDHLGCEVIHLYDEVDGNFPAHHPDPTIPENLENLKQVVLAEKADVGIAFDGDADRVGVITSKGEVIWPDRLMMFFARDVLSRKPNATIVYDVKCSKQLKDIISEHHGKPIMSPTGHSLVKAIMKTHHAELAGEMSGHIFFKDRWFGFDDGIYSACRFLEILSHYQDIDALLKTIPATPISTPEIKIDIADDKKFIFMDKIKLLPVPQEAELISIDGIRLEFSNGWGLLRASNTSPCLVCRFEADSQGSLKKIQQLFREMMLKIEPNLSIPF